jgi:hypothetical protein
LLFWLLELIVAFSIFLSPPKVFSGGDNYADTGGEQYAVVVVN